MVVGFGFTRVKGVLCRVQCWGKAGRSSPHLETLRGSFGRAALTTKLHQINPEIENINKTLNQNRPSSTLQNA